MSIKLGSKNSVGAYLGSKAISKIYLGNKLKFTKDNSLLPSEYQQVEYIQSNGTQCINTLIKPSDSAYFKLNFKVSFLNQTNAFVYFAGSNPWFSFERMNNYYWNIGSTVILGGHSLNTNTVYKYDVTHSNGTITSSGAYNFTASYSGQLGTDTLHFFGTGSNNSSCKLYNLQLYSGEDFVLVRDFIPCFRKSDGLAGLYDIISNQFYTDINGNNFLFGAIINDNFKNYQQVNYIRSYGNNVIELNYIPNNNTKVEVEFSTEQVTSDLQKAVILFGSAYNFDSSAYEFVLSAYGATYYGSQGPRSELGINIPNKKYLVIQDKNSTYIDGVLKNTYTQENFTSPYKMCVFATHRNYGYVISEYSKNLYYMKIYENNKLMLDLVPCYRKLDKLAGLYDKINNMFYMDINGNKLFYENSYVHLLEPTLNTANFTATGRVDGSDYIYIFIVGNSVVLKFNYKENTIVEIPSDITFTGTPRAETVGTNIYLFGSGSSNIWKFDTITETFSLVNSSVIANQRYDVATAVVDDIIYILGGSSKQNVNGYSTGDIYAFNPADNSYYKHGNLLTRINTSCACAYGHLIYTFPFPSDNIVMVYDTINRTCTANRNSSQRPNYADCVAKGNYAYVFGGGSNMIAQYDLINGGVLTQIKATIDGTEQDLTMLYNSAGLSVELVDQSVYIFGGSNNTIQKLDLTFND